MTFYLYLFGEITESLHVDISFDRSSLVVSLVCILILNIPRAASLPRSLKFQIISDQPCRKNIQQASWRRCSQQLLSQTHLNHFQIPSKFALNPIGTYGTQYEEDGIPQESAGKWAEDKRDVGYHWMGKGRGCGRDWFRCFRGSKDMSANWCGRCGRTMSIDNRPTYRYSSYTEFLIIIF